MARKTVKNTEEVKIRCRHCDIRQVCVRKVQKEQYEKEGWLTYCNQTPNRPRAMMKQKPQNNKTESQK